MKIKAITDALGFETTLEHIQIAQKAYQGWPLDLLKNTCQELINELNRVNPDGGAAWSFVHSMKIAIALRENYPSLKWVKSNLRNNLQARVKYKILDACVIGSEAKGTAKPDSDLDIAVIIPPVRGKTALKVSENYHAKFTNEKWKPQWNGRIVDFQFFYPNDPELTNYNKINCTK